MSVGFKSASVLERRRQRIARQFSLPMAPYQRQDSQEGWGTTQLAEFFDQSPIPMALFDDQLHVVRASSQFKTASIEPLKKTCRVGDLIECDKLKDSVVGCGQRAVCRSCLLHRGLQDTLNHGKGWHRVEVELNCAHGPCQGEPWLGYLTTILLDSQGRREVVLFLEQTRHIQDQERLQQLSMQLDKVEERQSQQLAEWLHDDVGQALVFAKMKVQMLRDRWKGQDEGEEMEDLCRTMTDILASVRARTVHLNSSVLMSLGFEAAVAHWLDEILEAHNGMDIRWASQGALDEIPAELQTILFRCLRELVINAIKHADANLIDIRAVVDSEQVCLEVQDDGKGLEIPSQAFSPGTEGYGLLSIRERMRQCRGRFEMHTSVGQGMHVRLAVPV